MGGRRTSTKLEGHLNTVPFQEGQISLDVGHRHTQGPQEGANISLSAESSFRPARSILTWTVTQEEHCTSPRDGPRDQGEGSGPRLASWPDSVLAVLGSASERLVMHLREPCVVNKTTSALLPSDSLPTRDAGGGEIRKGVQGEDKFTLPYL